MVEFEFVPIKKVIVHEILKWDLDEFIERYVNPKSSVQWVEGIIMLRTPYAQRTPKMVDDEINGVIHWAAVQFAEMPEFKPQLTNEKTATVGKVNDVSNNSILGEFVRYLKDNPRWFPKV